MLPHRRHEDLVVREIDRELLIYDRRTRRTVCLNESAAIIWSQCDGETGVEQLALLLGDRLGVRPDPLMVQVALSEFSRARLLDPNTVPLSARINRRDAIAGLAGIPAVLVPAVIALSAPTPAQAAASCRAAGKACTANAQCCSKLCTKVKGSLVCK